MGNRFQNRVFSQMLSGAAACGADQRRKACLLLNLKTMLQEIQQEGLEIIIHKAHLSLLGISDSYFHTDLAIVFADQVLLDTDIDGLFVAKLDEDINAMTEGEFEFQRIASMSSRSPIAVTDFRVMAEVDISNPLRKCQSLSRAAKLATNPEIGLVAIFNSYGVQKTFTFLGRIDIEYTARPKALRMLA